MVEKDLEGFLESNGFRRVRVGGVIDFNVAENLIKEQNSSPDFHKVDSITYVPVLALLNLYLKEKNPKSIILDFDKTGDEKYDVTAFIRE